MVNSSVFIGRHHYTPGHLFCHSSRQCPVARRSLSFHSANVYVVAVGSSAMASLFERDTSTIGTVVGLLAVGIALFGSTALGWEWGASGQPVAFVVGAVFALAAGWIALRNYRD
jgi:lipopolysaccharide export LptBFGC system permease protein LptF